LEQPVSTVMTKKDKLVTVNEGAAREEILGLMHEHRIEKILVVDDAFKLKGMITVKDYQKAQEKPDACKDDQGRLRVGAAVSVGAGTD
ncbi:CBS domain-containing protein, partial [Shewanella sp. TB4-MNA-CIBAN-0142]